MFPSHISSPTSHPLTLICKSQDFNNSQDQLSDCLQRMYKERRLSMLDIPLLVTMVSPTTSFQGSMWSPIGLSQTDLQMDLFAASPSQVPSMATSPFLEPNASAECTLPFSFLSNLPTRDFLHGATLQTNRVLKRSVKTVNPMVCRHIRTLRQQGQSPYEIAIGLSQIDILSPSCVLPDLPAPSKMDSLKAKSGRWSLHRGTEEKMIVCAALRLRGTSFLNIADTLGYQSYSSVHKAFKRFSERFPEFQVLVKRSTEVR
jgi:hypothetical protein